MYETSCFAAGTRCSCVMPVRPRCYCTPKQQYLVRVVQQYNKMPGRILAQCLLACLPSRDVLSSNQERGKRERCERRPPLGAMLLTPQTPSSKQKIRACAGHDVQFSRTRIRILYAAHSEPTGNRRETSCLQKQGRESRFFSRADTNRRSTLVVVMGAVHRPYPSPHPYRCAHHHGEPLPQHK